MSSHSWNKLAKDFEHSVCDITATSGDVLAKWVERIAPSRRQTLVDAGCGIGTFTARFGNRFGRVIGFDFASGMVRRARRRCRELTHAQWQTLPLEAAADEIGPVGHVVVCLNVVTSPDADLRARQWQSLGGLLRDHGHLLVVVPSLESARHVAEIEGASAEGDLLRRTDTLQKHYSRSQLRYRVSRDVGRVVALERIHYPWAEEGLEEAGTTLPWDWLCVAQRVA